MNFKKEQLHQRVYFQENHASLLYTETEIQNTNNKYKEMRKKNADCNAKRINRVVRQVLQDSFTIQ